MQLFRSIALSKMRQHFKNIKKSSL